VYYYICPQVWAWGAQRLLLMRRILRRAFLILPFEEPLYQAFGIRATFVGHPLLDVLPAKPPSRGLAFARTGLNPKRPLIVLLPGSRAEEVARHLPVFLKAARVVAAQHQELQWAVIVAPGSEEFVRTEPHIHVVRDPNYAIRAGARLAWTASGTSTLELGLLGVPQIVVYRGNWFNWMIARRLVRVPYVSLVNLILNRPAVPEYLQGALTPGALVAATRRRLSSSAARRQARRDARELHRCLGSKRATRLVAQAILDDL